MDFAQPLSFDPLGSDALEMIERALHGALGNECFLSCGDFLHVKFFSYRGSVPTGCPFKSK
ncbi:hypothetical protein CO656_26785 [Sinorhizobium sp. FG01]|uniref:Uncharacterized protein n=1 Tax=Sinorhizobium americanum TaxID=194963 RepID=A0A2S3YQL5_9HYPH|nr:hypothetical protein CO656_26785 [Sinorhizobium sp. FG01]POH33604.1 hypothetical protein ATY31_10165 [Sinorhizobium americanum]